MIHRIFFFLLIVFLPTQLGYHVWPEWAYVLGRRIDFLSPTLFISDILLAGTIFFWVIDFLAYKKSIKGLVLGIKENTLYLILNPSFIYINILHAASWQVSLYSWWKFLEYALLFLYIIKTKPSMQLLSVGLTIGILYSSVIAISQFLLQHSLGGIFWFLGERTFSIDTPGIARFPLCLPSFFGCIEFLRSYATFPHPNVFAGFLAVGIPILIHSPVHNFSENFIFRLIFKDIKSLLRGLRIAAIALGLLALLLTFSRSAVFVMVLYALLRVVQFFYFDKFYLLNTARPERSRREYRILNTAFMIHASVFKKVTILFVIPLCIVGLYLLKSVGSLEESVVVRQELISSAWTLFQSSPLFGIGLGNFIVRLPDVLTAHAVYFLQPVHNIYLLLLSEVGIVGMGLLLFSVFYLLNTEYRIMNTEVNSKLRQRIQSKLFTIQYSLFIILVLGLVDHYWLTLQQGQLLLVVVLGYSLVVFPKKINAQ